MKEGSDDYWTATPFKGQFGAVVKVAFLFGKAARPVIVIRIGYPPFSVSNMVFDALLDRPRLNLGGGLAGFENLEHLFGVLGGFGFGIDVRLSLMAL